MSGRPLQFGVRDLLLLMIPLGLACAVVGTDPAGWLDGLIAATSLLVAFGLCYQLADLLRTLRSIRGLTPDQRWGWRYAILWRALAAVLLAAYWMLRAVKVIPLSDRLAGCYDTNEPLSAALYVVLLVSLFSSVSTYDARGVWLVASRIVNMLALVAAVALSIFVFRQVAVVTALVHVAIQGVEASQPYRINGQVIYAFDVAARAAAADQLARASWWALGMTTVNFGLIWYWARRPPGRRRRSWIAGPALLVLLGLSLAYLVWARWVALPEASPFLAQEQLDWRWPTRVSGTAIVLLFFVSALAYRLVRRLPECPDGELIRWRRDSVVYYQENRAVLAIMGIAILCRIATEGGVPIVMTPSYYAPLAVVVLAWRNALLRPPRTHERQMQPASISPRRYLAVWILLLVATVCAVEAIGWGSFCYWLSGRP